MMTSVLVSFRKDSTANQLRVDPGMIGRECCAASELRSRLGEVTLSPALSHFQAAPLAFEPLLDGPGTRHPTTIQPGGRAEIVDLCADIIPDNARLLDIGCGTGVFILELGKKRVLQALGLDVSKEAVEIAKSRGVNAVVRLATDPNLGTLGSFNFVTLFEVLEHIQDAEVVLASVRRAFPEATVIASVPNTGYLASRLRLLFGRFPRQWIVHPGEHIRFWTLHDFRIKASQTGYQIVRVFPLRGSPSFSRLLPGLFGEALVFQMKPKS